VSNLAVQLCGVSKTYSHFMLRGIDREVPQGTALGLIGRDGAGKSTLLRILMGLVRADAGSMRVLGHDMPRDERWIKARVEFVSEDMALYGAARPAWQSAMSHAD